MRSGSWIALLAPLTQTACFITIAGKQLEPISPPPPAQPPRLEHSVGDFAFTLEGGKMITSNKAGRLLNEEILKRWKRDGYIESYEYVPSSKFSTGARYRLTLSGSQYGESSIGLQILSGLTLFLLPYSVDQKFDVQYTLEDAAGGTRTSASAQDHTVMWTELFLFFALPWSMSGANQTYDAMADHLYEQLRQQGAFEARPEPAGGAP